MANFQERKFHWLVMKLISAQITLAVLYNCLLYRVAWVESFPGCFIAIMQQINQIVLFAVYTEDAY